MHSRRSYARRGRQLVGAHRHDTGGYVDAMLGLKDLFDALTLCKFAPLSPTMISEFLGAITGWECSPQSLLAVGDRSLAIKRAISSGPQRTSISPAMPGFLPWVRMSGL